MTNVAIQQVREMYPDDPAVQKSADRLAYLEALYGIAMFVDWRRRSLIGRFREAEAERLIDLLQEREP